MTQTLRGRVIRNDNISAGNTTGTENAVAVAVPAPALLLENTILGVNAASAPTGAAATPYGIEKWGQPATTAPNPERLVGVPGPP